MLHIQHLTEMIKMPQISEQILSFWFHVIVWILWASEKKENYSASDWPLVWNFWAYKM